MFVVLFCFVFAREVGACASRGKGQRDNLKQASCSAWSLRQGFTLLTLSLGPEPHQELGA